MGFDRKGSYRDAPEVFHTLWPHNDLFDPGVAQRAFQGQWFLNSDGNFSMNGQKKLGHFAWEGPENGWGHRVDSRFVYFCFRMLFVQGNWVHDQLGIQGNRGFRFICGNIVLLAKLFCGGQVGRFHTREMSKLGFG